MRAWKVTHGLEGRKVGKISRKGNWQELKNKIKRVNFPKVIYYFRT